MNLLVGSLGRVIFVALYLFLEHILQVIDWILCVFEVFVVECVGWIDQQFDVVVNFFIILVNIWFFEDSLIVGWLHFLVLTLLVVRWVCGYLLSTLIVDYSSENINFLTADRWDILLWIVAMWFLVFNRQAVALSLLLVIP